MNSLKKYARTNRKNMPKAEKLLWDKIRKDQLGFRVLRQKIIGNYIADFYIAKYKLIIELDGEYHNETRVKDRIRDRKIRERGYRILRFWNYEVENNIEAVITVIKETIKKLSPSLPLSQKGGSRE